MARVTNPVWFALSPELIKLCWDYAGKVVGHGNIAVHLAHRGAEHDVAKWALSKMGECVFALECGLDPLKVLKWDPDIPDKWDVEHLGRKCDVKTTHPGSVYLLWSVAKNGIWEDTQFDTMVLTKVKIEEGIGFSYGWIPKLHFTTRHLVAGPNHKLDEGTWHMDQEDIWSMAEFFGDGPVVYRCETCGRFGCYGYGASPRKGIVGLWYCGEHRI